MRTVIIESPYAGDVERNRAYLQECILDSVRRGEAPFASHQMYTLALNDDVPAERLQGIQAGEAWRRLADATVIYWDHGISPGMAFGIQRALELGMPVEYRRLRK